jgi:hypothetical protein
MTRTEALAARTAYQAAKAKRAGSHVLGWKLDRAERTQLLARFPPRYGHVVADHVTLAAKVAAGLPVPAETEGRILGRADDVDGVEAMVVEIAGTTERPDGSTYHITWSLDPARGRRAVESNDVIRARGWLPLDAPVAIRLIPELWGRRR